MDLTASQSHMCPKTIYGSPQGSKFKLRSMKKRCNGGEFASPFLKFANINIVLFLRVFLHHGLVGLNAGTQKSDKHERKQKRNLMWEV